MQPLQMLASPGVEKTGEQWVEGSGGHSLAGDTLCSAASLVCPSCTAAVKGESDHPALRPPAGRHKVQGTQVRPPCSGLWRGKGQRGT